MSLLTELTAPVIRFPLLLVEAREMLDLTSAQCNWNGNKQKTIKSKSTNVCCTFLEREARECDFLITCDAIARLSASVTTVYLFFMACFEVAFTFQRKTLKVEYRNWTIYRTKTFLTFVIFGNFGRNWRFSQSTRGYSNSRAFSLYCHARNVSFVFPSSVSFSSLIRWYSRAAMLWRRNWRNIESTNLINSDNWEVYQVGIGRADRGRWFGLERQRFANLSTVLRTFRPAIETKTRLTFQRSCTPTPVKGLCF